ncbi:antitoxin Phd [Luteipulveratus sp. YIM 133132]|uniref:Antitoxin Phd n=1 Tax=Luteipulveratus flavus TaxID=3031728 RepID=A0ABT6C746_9MICO|nr:MULTISPECIES: antitoxin Phd [unclassified Luteipulveratus]MDE9366931.1 antitoxin Phd [Luteipulveratus sp. YIM 133132]MDF8264769.1 antitoxin Phd [Luteipulveratus sp. YIM 133296]
MPGLSLTFTDDELQDLRESAEREGTSLRTFAHRAVMEAVTSRSYADVAAQVARKSAELNDRLA